MQKYKRIEDQVIFNEPNTMPMEDLFIIQPEKPTKEEHVELNKLITKDPNELVAFKEDGISMQTSNFIDFVIKDIEKIEVFLVEFELGNLGRSQGQNMIYEEV